MTPRITASLAQMPARQLHLLLGGLVAVAAALVWTLLLRAPLGALRQQAAERSMLEQTESNPAAQRSELATLERETKAMATRLVAPGTHGSANDLQVAVIGALDQASARHGVRLSGAAPGPARTVARLQEVPFEFEAGGTYQGLFEWMADIESSQSNLGIVRFELRPAETMGQIAMKIRVTVYTLGGVPR